MQNGEIGTKNKGKFAINGNLVEIEDGKTIKLNLHDDLSNWDLSVNSFYSIVFKIFLIIFIRFTIGYYFLI